MHFATLYAAFRHFQLAYVAVRLGLPTALADGSRTAEELAESTGVPVDRLSRVLRGLLWAGLLDVDAGRFTLTDAGLALVDDSALGPAAEIRFQGEFFHRAWSALHEWVETGETPFDAAHGQGVFELLASSPELAEVYAAPMTARCAEYSRAVAAHRAVAGANRIVDVGGGSGQLLVDVLKVHQHAIGIVFDLPAMQIAAQSLIDASGVGDRCTFVPGDMFREVPGPADLYLLKWVLHDWDDERALAILRQCGASMSSDSRLLVIERLMPPEWKESAALAQADLNMLCLSGGAERTLDQYKELLCSSGLEVVSVEEIEQSHGLHAIECRRERS